MAGLPFDATMKDLIDVDARAWAERFNSRPILGVTIVNADLSTVTAHADKVLRVQEVDGREYLLNIEAEGRHAADAPKRLLHYSVLLSQHHDELPVRSVLLLLRSSANATNLTGTLERRHHPKEEPYLIFRYHIVRIWEEPLASLLNGPLGFTPLAALTNEAEADLPAIVKRVIQRLRSETTPEKSAKLETAMFVLLGLRYDAERIERLFEEVQEMEESTTYQLILSKGSKLGEARALREILLRLGRRKFGVPDEGVIHTLDEITDLERLRELTDRILDATTWQELFA